MTTPLVSIIVPVWNTAKFLPQCLDSLLAQTLKDIEIVCINDASLDNSLQILEHYASRDERIRLVSNPKNLGPGATRNIGIELAKGEYIGFLDSDDFVSNDFYQNLYQGALKHSADITITRCTVFDDSTASTLSGNSKNVISWLKQHWVHNVRGMDKTFGTTWHEHMDFSGRRAALSIFPTVVDKLYRRSLFDKVRFPEGVLFEDMLFMPQILFHAGRVFSCPGGEYYYRRNPGSITRRRRFSDLMDKLVVAGMLDQWVQQLELSNEQKTPYEMLVTRKYRQAVKGLAKRILFWTPARISQIKNQCPPPAFRIFIKTLATRILLICLVTIIGTVITLYAVGYRS
jgi:glycosyltransferase involved in cell wall biosynthesis